MVVRPEDRFKLGGRGSNGGPGHTSNTQATYSPARLAIARRLGLGGDPTSVRRAPSLAVVRTNSAWVRTSCTARTSNSSRPSPNRSSPPQEAPTHEQDPLGDRWRRQLRQLPHPRARVLQGRRPV